MPPEFFDRHLEHKDGEVEGALLDKPLRCAAETIGSWSG